MHRSSPKASCWSPFVLANTSSKEKKWRYNGQQGLTNARVPKEEESTASQSNREIGGIQISPEQLKRYYGWSAKALEMDLRIKGAIKSSPQAMRRFYRSTHNCPVLEAGLWDLGNADLV